MSSSSRPMASSSARRIGERHRSGSGSSASEDVHPEDYTSRSTSRKISRHAGRSSQHRSFGESSASSSSSTSEQPRSFKGKARQSQHATISSSPAREAARKILEAEVGDGTGGESNIQFAEEWEGRSADSRLTDIDAAGFTGQRVHRKTGDEPMSPLLVVIYVTALYLVFQLLTRSSEEEILSHLAPDSHLRYSHHADSSLPGASSHQHSYMPYGLPHIPSPIPPISGGASGSDQSIPWWRFLLGIIAYPFYLAVTLFAFPVPLLLNLLHVLVSVLGAVLYPITATTRLLFRTFLATPFGIMRSVMAVFYPIYVFVAGVVGTGLVLGVGAAWAGKFGLDLLLGRRSKKVSKRKPLEAEQQARRRPPAVSFTGSSSRAGEQDEAEWNYRRTREPNRKRTAQPVAFASGGSETDEDRYVDQMRGQNRAPGWEEVIGNRFPAGSGARGTAREGQAIGVRRRGVR